MGLLGAICNILVEGETQREKLKALLAAIHEGLVGSAQMKSAFRLLPGRKHRVRNDIVV